MLVLFLILFTTVLADSDEDKYIDLLPDEEKQEFLEKVARRILKDAESPEVVADAKSGEVDDETLQQHTEYVKSVLKEEQENRRNKGDESDKDEKPVTDELAVKPLASLKVSLFKEGQDLTLRKESREVESDKDSANSIKIEIVTDKTPIIKRSVQNDNSKESDENTAETLKRVSQTKHSSGIHEGSRRANDEDTLLVGNTTESNITTAVVGETTTENKPFEYDYTNVSNADEEFTTVTYPSEGSSPDGNDTESTTTDLLLVDSTTNITKTIDKESKPIFKSHDEISSNTENETETANITRTSIVNDQETTIFVPDSTVSVVTTTTTDIEDGKVSTEMATGTTVTTTEGNTENKTTVDAADGIQIEVKKLSVISIPDTVEDFTAKTISSTVEPITSKTEKPMIKKKAKSRTRLLRKITTGTTPETEISIEATTHKTIRHKIVVHKQPKHIVGPRAKKLAEAEKDSEQNNNFIELQKIFYNANNKDKDKVGKEYHVFEVPADSSPFVEERESITEQPYYVPIYNYSPNNAYFNPKNRLGPNPEDFEIENTFNDDFDELDRTETYVKMEYDRMFDSKRKKFGNKQKLSQTINKQPLHIDPQQAQTKVNPEDYMDSDYYFGRVRKLLLRKANDFNKFPNSDEIAHPAHSIQEGSLKDHVRAVRNILFQQKSFGLLDKDKYGDSAERLLRMGGKPNALREGPDDDLKNENENKNNDDYYFHKEKSTDKTNADQEELNNTHIQKIVYLKKQNDTKELYVMDDDFKATVEKYIQERGITPATPPPEQIKLAKRDKVIAYLRMEDRQQRAEKNKLNTATNERTRNVEPNQKYVPFNSIESYADQELNLKVNVRRNDAVKISVYLQVLQDMVTLDNKALAQYDWLGTAVDIQASLQKLFELTSLVANESDVHPADMEILKYVLFLHKLASEIIEAKDVGNQIRNKFDLRRRSKKKSVSRHHKEKGLINRIWLYLKKEVPDVNEQGALNNLNNFMMDVEDGLYDLHDAIKNIAKITKYKNQHWYQNLKDLYINTEEKHLLELLLHMTSLRLFSLIEESAKNGLEDDYIRYMKKNRKHCKNTLEEMMFVMEVLEEYKKFIE